MDNTLILLSLFLMTALVYSMAGLAGGSTYLALLTLFAFPYGSIPKVALLCNLVVSAGGTWQFARLGHLSLKKVVPFMVTSIPMALWGGSIPIGRQLFTILLAVSLLIAALRLLIADQAFKEKGAAKQAWGVGLTAGALLGFLSGLIGIGGGIFLSPVLLLTGSADSRQAAAASSLFIFVNSLAGLAGQFTKGGMGVPVVSVGPLLAMVFIGGQIGSRLGSQKISKLALQRVTAVLVLFVSGRLFWGVAAGGLR